MSELSTHLAARSSFPVGPLGCRIWFGATSPRDYPVARIDGKLRQVRRLVYESQRRKLSASETVRMECGERRCVLVDHMHVTLR